MQDSADPELDEPERSMSAARFLFDADLEEGEMHLQALFTLNAVNSRKGLDVRVLLRINTVSMLSYFCSTDSAFHHVQKYVGSLAVRLTMAISPATQLEVEP
jgi:hypothetical protein